MITSRHTYTLSAVLIATICSGAASSAEDVPEIVPDSVNDYMTSVVTPSTNTLWGIDNPQTDAEWNAIDNAAVEVINVFKLIKEGGAGENDKAWAANPDWDAMVDEVIAAAEMARKAIADRSVDDVLGAGDVLYTPCENCHLLYHPDIANQ